jgi:hypothetical protein
MFLPTSESDQSWVYWYKFIYYPTYNRLDGLLVGVAIAGIYQQPGTTFKSLEIGGSFRDWLF